VADAVPISTLFCVFRVLGVNPPGCSNWLPIVFSEASLYDSPLGVLAELMACERLT
jgi:hypothetical protein